MQRPITHAYHPRLLRPSPALIVITGLCLAGLFCTTQASSQVLRCTNPKTGTVTYTNGSCAATDSGLQIQAAPSPEEVERERAQAKEALERLDQQLARDEAARRARIQQEQREKRERERAQAQNGNASSPACDIARRRLDAILAEEKPEPVSWSSRSQLAQQRMEMACMSPQAYEQLQQTRALQPVHIHRPGWAVAPRPPRPQPPPAPITSCNVFRCYDRNGGIHPIP
ncbi:DUF4124 domain-containing protein [Comamonas composti]|uniref:DUF4124 domain-containing protein n=1 Tax=Comamonas composti TaxID=408558 RepID=UPI00040B0748|nr:DUF4124 domain-containing protein [Comamonas composti]